MKLKKLLSVILSVLMVLSTVNVVAFAAEPEETPEENIISEIEEQLSDEIEEAFPDGTEKMSYTECFEGFITLCLYLMGEGSMLPLMLTVVSVAFTPSIVTLPVTLPISAVAGLAMLFAGIFGILVSPVGAGIMYFNQ